MQADNSRIGALDGLRALAILLVMMFHFTRGHAGSALWRITDIGWAGVDLFFVLSGFLITGILLRSKGAAGYFRNFYSRRALRILPLYYATLAVAFLLVPWVFSGCPSIPLDRQAPFWFYYANFPLVPDSPCYVLGHFWSLAIEEQFYLLWPVVLLRLRDSTASRICLFLIATSVVSRAVLAVAGAAERSTFTWTFSRFDGLALGALIALCMRSEELRERMRRVSPSLLAGSAALLMAIVMAGQATRVFDSGRSAASILVRTGLPLLLAIFFAALMVTSLTVSPIGRLFTGSVASAIARYSYGAYVFHLLLMPVYLHAYPTQRAESILGRDLSVVVFAVLGMIATLAIAAASYHGFENFFLALRPKQQEGAGAALASANPMLT